MGHLVDTEIMKGKQAFKNKVAEAVSIQELLISTLAQTDAIVGVIRKWIKG